MTGYAKDYIGQLCREGRVPARLVGRSWYVLETAIQDHRFGDQKTEQEKEEEAATPPPSSVWAAPRYEATPTEVLPSVNRLKREDSQGFEEKEKGDSEAFSQRLQDSWRAWFDRIEARNTEPTTPAIMGKSQEESPEEPVEPTKEREEEEVNIPIHTVYELPPSELLPLRRSEVRSFEEGGKKRAAKRRMRWALMAVQFVGALFALLSVAAAVIGTGYMDRYIVSVKQVSMISGSILYNK